MPGPEQQTDRVIRTTRDVYDAMIEQALDGRPFETCGILAGSAGTITTRYPTTNAASIKGAQYVIDPKDVLRISQAIDEDDQEMIGIYHSHPFTRAYPSATDLAQAWEGLVYVIVSLTDFRAPAVQAFTVADGQVAEHAIEIV
jgi:proteasome lid subunit RPN8/RPN11